ncbi:MAG: TauD/TfdA family dioxygenase [Lentisphaeria bacterium]|jgi:alpha-ketoglutarate-dependent 2,4-dichlorophenoxyacetate dioxygenase|nr:TauD/TfdA family dioxygenase [Lentisphaeria bacterium]MDP7740408.1 TauD/TfdA family dioxygenase [Lentisphaeria bacterium]
MTLSINPLTEHIGAEVQGVDLTAPIGEETFAQLRDALYRHTLLVFHDQQITDEQQVALTGGFGTADMMLPSDPAGDGGPIAILSNLDEKGDIIPPDDSRILYTIANTLWHSDGSFRRVPLRGSLLAAKVVPPTGGETEFASACASYAMLPDEKKAELQGLVAEHSMAHSRAQIAPDLLSDEFLKDTPPVGQLVVRPIPETGAKALLVGSYAARIIGWPIEKGQALLQELLDWVTQPQFVYRHNWRVNDLLVYDNRCCLHRGRSWDRAVCKRVLHRTTLAGDGPMT